MNRGPTTTAASRRFGCGLSILAGWAVAAAVPASADPPNPSTFVQCFAAGNNSFDSTECSQGGFPGVPPSAMASSTRSPYPSASAEVTVPSISVLGAGADANTTYWFEVSGGAAGDVVPLVFDFSLSVSATPESSALARLIIHTSALETPHVEELICNPQECDATALSDSVNIEAKSGPNLNSVTLYALAQAVVTGVSNESARAYADPYIYVDPAFPNAGLYGIVVSPGIGNVPVPEPASPWLAGAALGGLGLVRNRRALQARGTRTPDRSLRA